LSDKEPIRLLTTLPKKRFSKNQVVTMYLERWWVESSFKRIKDKFNLERIRVLKNQTFLNLIALSLFAMLISTVVFQRIQKANNQLIVWVLLLYKLFIKKKSLWFNLDSFISYVQYSLPKMLFREQFPPDQLQLFEY
jgi:transposase